MYKILIVEDDMMIAKTLSSHLEKWDYEVRYVKDFKNVMNDFLEFDPQLVLMDIEMPVMNGLDAAAIIHKAMPETHIVFLTAFDRFDYAVGAMRAGGTDYLVKPFDSAQITACLRKLNLLPESRPRGQAGKCVLHPVFRVAGASLHAGCVARSGGRGDGHECVLLLTLFSHLV